MKHRIFLPILWTTLLCAQPARLDIDAATVTRQIDPKIYGHFLEHIYHSVNGGVWGDVVWNRSFEERLSPDDWTTHGAVIVSPPAVARESRFSIGAETWKDYDLILDVQRTGAPGSVSIGARATRGNAVTLSFDGKQAELSGAVNNRQTRTTNKSSLASAPFAMETNHWYRIRIHVEGHRIQAFVDNKPLLDAQFPTGSATGQAFLATNNATAEFRNLRAVSSEKAILFDSLPSPARHWKNIGIGDLALDATEPLNSKFSLRISGAAGAGVVQDQFAVRKGDTLRGSIGLRGDAPGGISVRLLSGTYVLAQASFPPTSKRWFEYPLALTPEEDAPNAVLEIQTRGPSNVNVDQVSLMPDSYVASGSFRSDLTKAVEALHPPVIRWPGGSFTANYRWKDAIGPQSKRVGKSGPWDELDPLSYGIDEFISFCRRVGAEPIVVINIGSRTAVPDRTEFIQDARDFVEYCNGPITSKWGRLRAVNGHREPYNVKYWEIDNEVWNLSADDYVKVLNQFIPAMKLVDPKIQTIACGSGGLGGRWKEGDLAVIDQAAQLVDYLSIHHYENPDRFAAGPAAADKYFNELGGFIAKSRNPNLKLFLSEWNAQSTDWRTGLYAAGLLNTMERSPYIGMASPALFLRHVSAPAWDNAFINFDSRGWFPAPNYVVMKLFHDHFASQLLKVSGSAANLDATASKSADGKRVVVRLVNPTDAPRDVALNVQSFPAASATLYLVSAGSLSERNSMEHPNFIQPKVSEMVLNGSSATVAMPKWSVALVEVAAASTGPAAAPPPAIAQPDLLTLRNGQPVPDAQTWWKKRRPEIVELLESQQFGRNPNGKLASQISAKWRVESIARTALGGKAVRKQVTISFQGVKDGPKLHLLLYVPATNSGPVPAVLGLNFNGNHTVDADPGIDLTSVWVRDPKVPANAGPGQLTHTRQPADASKRGSAASQWQIEKIISRGYAVATIYCGDIEPDFNGGMPFGVRQMFAKSKQASAPDAWGGVAAWAWGLSRAMDYLQADSDIDSKKVAVFGFSRLGKAAAWAAARDQRFAMLISNESGQGGVSLLRRKAGERLEHLYNTFPHWWDANYAQYIGKEETLPIDGHMLVALVAPRPAYIASADGDKGSDPEGEFLSAAAASRVYRLLGTQGLPATAMPAIDHPVMGDLGYHSRTGKHDVTAYDWEQYLTFMDRHFLGKK